MTRLPKGTAAAVHKITKELDSYLSSLSTSPGILNYTYTIPTICGDYYCRVDEGAVKGTIWVMGRFALPEMGATKTNCNPNSGKWNHYIGITPDFKLDDFYFVHELNKLLLIKVA